jgi:hypothetical protein
MTTTMTREEAIRNYVEQLNGKEIVELLRNMNAYDGCFENCTYYYMDEFDELLSDYTPRDLSQRIFYGGKFNPNDEYFRFDDYGNLETANGSDIVADTRGAVDDMIYNLVNYYQGDTPWYALNALVHANEGTIFYVEVDIDE